MHPELCKIGPITLYSYGLMLVIAFGLGSYLASRQGKKEGLNPDIIFNLLFSSFISGIIGARLFYVIEHIYYYAKNPAEIFMLQYGGLSWFGGLILGVVTAVIYIRKKKLSIHKTLDLVVPFVALAQSIGRVGCFLNGCCYGRESAHGIFFPVHNAVLIPAQIYSSLLLLIIFVVLRFLQDRAHKSGQVFYAYLLLYSLKRFFIEFWREDNPVILAGLTLFQLLSIAAFLIAVGNLILIGKRSSGKSKS